MRGLNWSSLSSAEFAIFRYTKGYVNYKSGCGSSKELWYTISLTMRIKISFFRSPRNDIALLSSALQFRVPLYIFWSKTVLFNRFTIDWQWWLPPLLMISQYPFLKVLFNFNPPILCVCYFLFIHVPALLRFKSF